ncbi:MAG: hypothetical protein GY811_18850 [Myxococcales bacterium]|nr:hypothetical protein [Myxococcales bacterium]
METTHYIHAIAWNIERREEGQTLDVMPVQVREQDGCLAGALCYETVAEVAETCACVEDDTLLACSNFRTACVTGDTSGAG